MNLNNVEKKTDSNKRSFGLFDDVEGAVQTELQEITRQPIPISWFGHTLAVGRSGSGKTESKIAPITREILASRTLEGEEASVLVIDAKDEYQQIVTGVLSTPERLVVLNGAESEEVNRKKQRFNPFESEINKSLVDKVMSIYDNCAGASISDAGNNAIFAAGGRALMRSFMMLDQGYFEVTNRSLFGDVNQIKKRLSDSGHTVDKEQKLIEEFEVQQRGRDKRHTELELERFLTGLTYDSDYFSVFNIFVDSSLDASMLSGKGWNSTLNWAVFMAQRVGLSSGSYGFLTPFKMTERVMYEQWYYKTSYFQSLFSLLLNNTVRSYCDLNPFELQSDSTVETVSLTGHWNQGGVVLLKLDTATNEDEGFDFVGRMLKSIFFKYTFSRKNKARPVAYICDEFHRFITVDRETGEQHYLDRCRSYNAACVLATQSIQSIKEAAKTQSGRDETDAIEILLNNTANKFFFGTTDYVTQTHLERLVPRPMIAGMPNVAEVRRLSTLRQGQCYAFYGNGDWEIKQFDLPALQKRHGQLATLLKDSKGELSPSASFTLC